MANSGRAHLNRLFWPSLKSSTNNTDFPATARTTSHHLPEQVCCHGTVWTGKAEKMVQRFTTCAWLHVSRSYHKCEPAKLTNCSWVPKDHCYIGQNHCMHGFRQFPSVEILSLTSGCAPSTAMFAATSKVVMWCCDARSKTSRCCCFHGKGKPRLANVFWA